MNSIKKDYTNLLHYIYIVSNYQNNQLKKNIIKLFYYLNFHKQN